MEVTGHPSEFIKIFYWEGRKIIAVLAKKELFRSSCIFEKHILLPVSSKKRKKTFILGFVPMMIYQSLNLSHAIDSNGFNNTHCCNSAPQEKCVQHDKTMF